MQAVLLITMQLLRHDNSGIMHSVKYLSHLVVERFIQFEIKICIQNHCMQFPERMLNNNVLRLCNKNASTIIGLPYSMSEHTILLETCVL